jgi:monoamine oxidase
VTARFRRARRISELARASGAPVDEVTEQLGSLSGRGEGGIDRRTVLKGAMAAAVVPLARPRAGASEQAPRIVVVGGGLAGLRCAHKLWTQRGLASTVYEGSDRLGGRVQTVRDVFVNGQIVERCGEFISSEHLSMRRLAARFHLTLDNTDAYPPGTVDTFQLNGGRYTEAMLNADWHEFGWQLFHRTISTAPWPTTYRSYTPEAYALDHQSAAEWIDANIPGGLASDFGQLCYLDVESDYGGAPEHQSALNLIYLLGYDDSKPGRSFQPRKTPALGGTDEKWTIHGGNDQVVSGMLSELPPGTTLTGRQLVALRDNGNLTYTCTFATDGVATDVVADHVVLAIPFNKLREVDLQQTEMSPRKLTAINSLNLGTNAKVALQVAGNPWNADGYTGNTFLDNPAVSGWDTTVNQPSTTSIFFDYLGGAPGAGLAARYGLTQAVGTPPARLVDDYLNDLEPVFPGITRAWELGPRLAWYSDPNLNPFLDGSYSQYAVGQYTGFSGIEAVRQGNIHFAGEQSSADFQGFMEGAVTTGERAASEI